MVRNLLFLLVVILTPSVLYGQDHHRLIFEGETDFNKIEEAFYKYWERNGKKDSEYRKFKRWEYFVKPRLVNGHIPGSQTQSLRFSEFENLRKKPGARIENTNAWEAMGPYQWDVAPGGYSPGNGRVNCITVDPNDPDKIFLGAASGGIWKSTDGGQSWSTTTDQTAVLGVTDIYINPANSNEIIALTGDAYGSDTPSIGLIKSTDGGDTWAPMGLEFDANLYYNFFKFEVNPQKPDTMMVAGRGVYQTTDGGDTWDFVLAKWISDLIIHPTNPDIVYAVDRFEDGANECTVYKSTDGGATWEEKIFIFPTLNKSLSRKALSVTPDNPNAVYVLASSTNSEFGALFKSLDEMETLDMQSKSPNIFGYSQDGGGSGGQGWYDLALAVDPDNEDVMYASGVHIWKSENSGVTWELQNYWIWENGDYPYVHADNHTLDFYNGKLYAGGDGGIFVTEDEGDTFVDLSPGLNIGQFYRLSVHPTDEEVVAGGLQDNGSFYRYNNTWSQIYGADGMEVIIDHTDPSINYSSLQFGTITRYSNHGQQIEFFLGKPPNEEGGWVTPYIMHPEDHNTLYFGFKDVYRSRHQGASMIRISNFNSDVPIRDLKQHPLFPDYMMAHVDGNVWLTEDEGKRWSIFSSKLPSSDFITDIEFSYSDPEIIYVTVSNWLSNSKVFMTDDRGDTWTNISDGLPKVPVNCILSKNDCSGTLYAGTDIGVYRRDNIDTDWVPIGTGLPNVIITELEIQYPTNKLFAATYGRGIWKVEMEANGNNELFIATIPPKEFGDPEFDLEITSTDPNSVVISSSDPDILSFEDETATIHKAGEIIITVQLEECIREIPLVIDRATQTITFDDPGLHLDTEWDFELIAESSSGLPVSFNSQNLSIITINGNLAEIKKSGSTFITAIQGGDEFYKPSIPIRKQVVVQQDLDARISVYPNPVTGDIMRIYIPKSIGTTHVVVHDLQGRLIMERDIPAEREPYELDVSELSQGMYVIKFNQEVIQFLKQ